MAAAIQAVAAIQARTGPHHRIAEVARPREPSPGVEAIEVTEIVCLLYGANEAQERHAGRVHFSGFLSL